MSTRFKISFELDEQDAAYFRGLYRKAKQNASKLDAQAITRDALKLVEQVRSSKRVPSFVVQAIGTLETDLGIGRRRLRLCIELVVEQLAQRTRRARITREQRAFHGLWQVDERKDRPIEIGEVRRDRRRLGFRQGLRLHVGRHHSPSFVQ